MGASWSQNRDAEESVFIFISLWFVFKACSPFPDALSTLRVWSFCSDSLSAVTVRVNTSAKSEVTHVMTTHSTSSLGAGDTLWGPLCWFLLPPAGPLRSQQVIVVHYYTCSTLPLSLYRMDVGWYIITELNQVLFSLQSETYDMTQPCLVRRVTL